MDAITVALPCEVSTDETFTIMTSDFDPVTSVMGIAGMVDTIPNEILVKLSSRLPRLYASNSSTQSSPNQVTPSLNVDLPSDSSLQHVRSSSPLSLKSSYQDLNGDTLERPSENHVGL